VNPTTFTHQPEARRTKKLNQVLTTRTRQTQFERIIWRLDASLTPYSPFWTYPLDDRTLLATHFLTPFHRLLLDSLSRLRQTTAAVLAPPFAPTCVRETISLSDPRIHHYNTEHHTLASTSLSLKPFFDEFDYWYVFVREKDQSMRCLDNECAICHGARWHPHDQRHLENLKYVRNNKFIPKKGKLATHGAILQFGVKSRHHTCVFHWNLAYRR